MAENISVDEKVLTVGNAQLFCQIRGKGPALLLIPGIGGDSGPFEVMANKLAEKNTVITYDRRGHSRSTPPFDWHITSIAEQADDATGLLKAAGFKSAIVYGNDTGGLILLEMLIRHPHSIKKAILHDPTVYSPLETGPHSDVPKGAGDMLRSAFLSNGPQSAINMFLRWEYSPEALMAIPSAMLARIIKNGEVFVMTEFPSYAFYKPDEVKLAEIKTPAVVLSSTTTPAWRRVMCNWVAERIHAQVIPFLGGHAPYFDHPLEMADALSEHL
jgi:pimeloyl-ACP methyl ester carboxylesterase